jgi:hypothetical protein
LTKRKGKPKVEINEIEEFAAKVIALGGSRWTKGEMDRIYITPRKLAGFNPEGWTNGDWAACGNQKYFFDLVIEDKYSDPTSLQVKAGANQGGRTYFGFAEDIENCINAQLSLNK